MKKLSPYITFDTFLAFFLICILPIDYFHIVVSPVEKSFLIGLAIIGAIPVVASAYYSILNKKISVDLLASVALIFSLLAREWLSAIFINLMLDSSRILMSYNEARARKSIEGLMKLKPKKIKIKNSDDTITEVVPKQVKVGDRVIADLGERIPIDGVVVSGSATVDESSITGESLPVTKSIGDKVLSSTLLITGNLTIQTEKVGSDTTLEKIIRLVEQAQIDKPDIHTSAEKFAMWYLIIVFIGSFIAYVFSHDTMFVLALLLVVCADDIAVAIPLTFLTAISFCARNGVIVKGASYIEALRDVKVIFVDKTGTLTKGKLMVAEFVSDATEKTSLLTSAGLIAVMSDHPIAKSIVSYVKALGVNLSKDKAPEHFEENSGKGVSATFGQDNFLLAKVESLEEKNIFIPETAKKSIQDRQDHGYNITALACNGVYKGFFVISDEVKPDIKADIEKLKALGVERIIMLTGDNERVASRIAKTLDIEYHASVLPEQKLEFIKKAISPAHKVMMVGDGINDAAALSLADIGIAMGAAGLDVAIESANIVLMKDNFSKIPDLIMLSQYVMKISNEDFWIWGITNLFGLGLVFSSILAPTGAAAYNFLTDFLPLFNSTRVFKLYIRNHKKV